MIKQIALKIYPARTGFRTELALEIVRPDEERIPTHYSFNSACRPIDQSSFQAISGLAALQRLITVGDHHKDTFPKSQLDIEVVLLLNPS